MKNRKFTEQVPYKNIIWISHIAFKCYTEHINSK